MSDISYFTEEGFEKLKQELHELKTVKRTEMAKTIAEAREKGDLRENAEYDAAKEAQGMLEAEIAKLENMVANARILEGEDLDTSKAYVLSTVTVFNKKMNRRFDYTLVSGKEADIKSGKISVDSPIGKALLGRSVGDEVAVEAPAGKIELVIEEIKRT